MIPSRSMLPTQLTPHGHASRILLANSAPLLASNLKQSGPSSQYIRGHDLPFCGCSFMNRGQLYRHTFTRATTGRVYQLFLFPSILLHFSYSSLDCRSPTLNCRTISSLNDLLPPLSFLLSNNEMPLTRYPARHSGGFSLLDGCRQHEKFMQLPRLV